MVWFIASLAGLQKVIVQLSHVGCHFSIPPSKMNAAKWQSEHGQLGIGTNSWTACQASIPQNNLVKFNVPIIVDKKWLGTGNADRK